MTIQTKQCNGSINVNYKFIIAVQKMTVRRKVKY